MCVWKGRTVLIISERRSFSARGLLAHLKVDSLYERRPIMLWRDRPRLFLAFGALRAVVRSKLTSEQRTISDSIHCATSGFLNGLHSPNCLEGSTTAEGVGQHDTDHVLPI